MKCLPLLAILTRLWMLCREMQLYPGGIGINLLKDDNLPRNEWQLARVVEAEPDSDGLVQKVKITVADRSLDQSGQRVKPPCVLERPIQKLVLLVACESS